MERPSWAPLDVDINQPSIARIWDCFLGGAHNFAIDREVAKKTLELMPEGPMMAHINRMFLRRAVRYCVRAGITQFLDLGSGIPTVGNVHEVAQEVDPRCRVLYADIDPVAVAHTRLMLADDPQSSVVLADLRNPDAVLSSPELGDTLDLSRPVAVMMIAVLHFVSDADDPAAVIARYRDALSSGSHLVIAHGSRETDQMPAEHLNAAHDMYEDAVAPVTLRSRPEVEALFTGFDLLDPGVAWLHHWRPTNPQDATDRTIPHAGYGGVGRKP